MYKKVHFLWIGQYIILFIMSLFCFSCANFIVDEEKLCYGDLEAFWNATGAVKLSEPSTLKLENNLPKIGGDSDFFPLYSVFARAVYPPRSLRSEIGFYTDEFDYIYSDRYIRGTLAEYAYRDLINGDYDIIFCAKPPAEVIEMAKEKNIELHITPVGYDAFVFFVNKKNPVYNLTTEQITGIYSGKIKKWHELGGKRNNIRLYEGLGNTILETIVGDVEIIEPIRQYTLGEGFIVYNLANYHNYRNALGHSYLIHTTQMVRKNKIKYLLIDNIFPSNEAIRNGTYPYSNEFYAITANTENENVNKFIEWILSEQGQYLVEKMGFVPIKGE